MIGPIYLDALLAGLEWQLVDPETDGWEFGKKVRGVVRGAMGEIYYDPDRPACRWIWMTHGENGTRGESPYRWMAMDEVEEAVAKIIISKGSFAWTQ